MFARYNGGLCAAIVVGFMIEIGIASAADGGTREPHPFTVNIDNSNNTNLDDNPMLIWWSTNLYPHPPGDHVSKCRQGSCHVTKNRLLKDHPAVRGFLFYGTEFEPENVPLPRLKHHEWALLHEESPLNNFMLDHSLAMSLFNYTATYHRAADFPLTLLSWPGTDFMLHRKPVATSIKNDLKWRKGLAPIVYVQSHCEVPSDRDRYVEELMKHIKVDSYGKCLHNKDLPEYLQDPVESMFDSLFKDLMAEYKFTLSFENGICNDYMTEKLFRPLHLGSVPIYKGSPLVNDYIPDDHSIIRIDDFASPNELADFIHHLDKNDDDYERYLEFKRKGMVTNPSLKAAISEREKLWSFTENDSDYGSFIEEYECFFCDKIHERLSKDKQNKENSNISLLAPKITDGRLFSCPQPQPHSTPERGDWWYSYDFPELYWRGLDQARTLRDMLLANESDINAFPTYARKYEILNHH